MGSKEIRKVVAKVDARRKAREAKAVLDANRAKHDKQIEDITTAYYVDDAKLDDLRSEIATLEESRNAHVLELLKLGETSDRVAVLTGLTTREVKQIKRSQNTTTGENR